MKLYHLADESCEREAIVLAENKTQVKAICPKGMTIDGPMGFPDKFNHWLRPETLYWRADCKWAM